MYMFIIPNHGIHLHQPVLRLAVLEKCVLVVCPFQVFFVDVDRQDAGACGNLRGPIVEEL